MPYASNSDTVNEGRVYFILKLPSEIIPKNIDKFISKTSSVVESY